MFVSTLLIFSCTSKDDLGLEKDISQSTEVKLAPEGYLIFDSWKSFIKYTNLPVSDLPKNFVSLNNVIRDLKAEYQKSQNIEDLRDYYKNENGSILPNYQFIAFSSLLDQNKIIQVEDKLIKMDFDNLKESQSHDYQELVDDINIIRAPSSSKFSFENNITRSSATCIGYIQISQVYSLAIGSYVADDMGHPDPVVGTFRANGGSLHYTGNSSSYSSFLVSFNSNANPHGKTVVTLDLPCRDVYVTFSSYSGRIEFTSVGKNVNCDYDGIPTSTGSTMNACE